MIEWLENIFTRQSHHTERLVQIEKNQEIIMAGQADLAAAITALPDAITAAVMVPVKAEIAKIEAGAQASIDTQPTIDSLNAIPALVSSAVTTALAAPPA